MTLCLLVTNCYCLVVNIRILSFNFMVSILLCYLQHYVPRTARCQISMEGVCLVVATTPFPTVVNVE